MTTTALARSQEFLKVSSQFKLGALTTEASHPVTARLSDEARKDIAAALDLLFQVDADVLERYREWSGSGQANEMQQTVLAALRAGGRMIFTGCGATGRLSILLVSLWRKFWRQSCKLQGAAELEQRAVSVMAGGDFALIKSVEGFEDYAAFGRKQMMDVEVSAKDVVFAITEGGETSFVIGTAWASVDAGAPVYFVYNNPDDVLCGNIERSRDVIQDARIRKVNLTTGPMAITGSTRMQATSCQLCVLVTVMEMVLQELTGAERRQIGDVPRVFLDQLREVHTTLRSPSMRESLARLVELEERVYRAGARNNYHADRFGIDVLTDTTERSPTFCTPPFRKFDDAGAAESWSFLFVPEETSAAAWHRLLGRPARCIDWTHDEIRSVVAPDRFDLTIATVSRIRCAELMRFRIGLDGVATRPVRYGDSVIAVVDEVELASRDGYFKKVLNEATRAGAATGLIALVRNGEMLSPVRDLTVRLPVPATGFLLDGVARVGLKMLLNALSTCTMVRMGRVMGNYMIWVVPSNLKLIDRATRYVQKLAGLDYAPANQLLFECLEYVEPRMKSDQLYPPVVGLAVIRAQRGLSNEAAEAALAGR